MYLDVYERDTSKYMHASCPPTPLRANREKRKTKRSRARAKMNKAKVRKCHDGAS